MSNYVEFLKYLEENDIELEDFIMLLKILMLPLDDE